MRSLTSLGIGLGLVSGCLILALIAELYYLLWWKKRITNREVEDDFSGTSAREFSYMFCWKKPSSLSSTALNPQQLCNSMRMIDSNGNEVDTLESNSSKDFLLRPFGFGEDSIEAELIRMHNLAGPPRFLFTIKEETKEDLEDDKSRKGSRSLADHLLVAVESPFLTPMASPPLFTPPLTPINCSRNHGFNPLLESSTDAEMNRIISSPPPKFKFMKDAEEKLYRRILKEEAERRVQRSTVTSVEDDRTRASSPTPAMVRDEKDGSFVSIVINKSKDRELHQHLPQHYSSSSQVLPLSSSPSTIRTAI